MTKIKVVKKITDKGWPVQNKKYSHAHEQASHKEKLKDPVSYRKSLKLERKLKKGELMAKHTKSGIIEIEKKFSKDKRLKKDLITHEKEEHRIMTKKKRTK